MSITISKAQSSHTSRGCESSRGRKRHHQLVLDATATAGLVILVRVVGKRVAGRADQGWGGRAVSTRAGQSPSRHLPSF